MGDYPGPCHTSKPKQIKKTLTIVCGTRREQPRQLTDAWLAEEENSRYRYGVETGKDGKKVYLRRPTWLNEGFDFQINYEGFKSKSNEAPKHADLKDDLITKKKESPADYKKLRELIDAVYECGDPDEVLKRYPNLKFESGLPVDVVLKIIKWLFIEQDLTYWNNSGRRMFMRAICALD